MPEWFSVAAQTDFSEGQSRLIEVDDKIIAVFNLSGQYYALEDVCTHDGSPLLGCGLDPADLIEGDQLICPRHGARFCIRNGEALTAPAYEPITLFPVRIYNGIVQVGDDRDA